MRATKPKLQTSLSVLGWTLPIWALLYGLALTPKYQFLAAILGVLLLSLVICAFAIIITIHSSEIIIAIKLIPIIVKRRSRIAAWIIAILLTFVFSVVGVIAGVPLYLKFRST